MRRCETSVVKSSGWGGGEERGRSQVRKVRSWRTFPADSRPTRTVYDSLPVHFPLRESSQELRRDGVLPVLTVPQLLLQRWRVWQQRQRRVYTPADTQTHRKSPFNQQSNYKKTIVLAEKTSPICQKRLGLARLTVARLWGTGGDTDTHLRLDRGVYGGVGFSRDLSLRERRQEVRKVGGEISLIRGHRRVELPPASGEA